MLGEDECVDLETAIRGVTINAAKQIGIDGMVGTLEVGKKADMVILSQDPRGVELKDLDNGDKLRVMQTWMGGQLRYQESP